MGSNDPFEKSESGFDPEWNNYKPQEPLTGDPFEKSPSGFDPEWNNYKEPSRDSGFVASMGVDHCDDLGDDPDEFDDENPEGDEPEGLCDDDL